MAPMALKDVVWLFPMVRPSATMSGTKHGRAHRSAHHGEAWIAHPYSFDDRLAHSNDPAAPHAGPSTGPFDWLHERCSAVSR